MTHAKCVTPLGQRMIDDLTSYFNKTPNVSFMEGGARSNRSISIRGVSDVGGLTSSFAVYVDEFNVELPPFFGHLVC